jgi:hypothetical protein
MMALSFAMLNTVGNRGELQLVILERGRTPDPGLLERYLRVRGGVI